GSVRRQFYTERAVEILTRYQSTLRSPEEQELKASIGKVSHIFRSELFQALLGKALPCSPWGFVVRSCTGVCL
uniref:L27-1 domain-containing protein n=1 Tax=Amazona collaria TaxID=241587 RepID=A0A8B9GF87_9PSIT